MLVYRIVLSKYDSNLSASSRAARWNNNDVKVIYTSSSQSLACLENVVHRSKLGLSANFSVLVIEIPDSVAITTLDMEVLPNDWKDFANMYLTQKIGDNWIYAGRTAVLKVPSSIVSDEYNYLINPLHPDFEVIKLVKTKPFLFDDRIKFS